MECIQQSFFVRDTLTIAQELLGTYLVRDYQGQQLIGKIVEIEAYVVNDPAYHAYKGKTKRICFNALSKGLCVHCRSTSCVGISVV